MPHGIISSNQRRSVLTLSARPCVVTPRFTRTPIGAELSLAVDPDAGSPLQPLAVDAERRGRVDDRRLERADVATQVERIAAARGSGRPRSGPGPWKVMSPPRSMRTSSAPISRSRSRAGQQVRRVATAADGVDGEVLEQQQAVADPPRPPLLGELVLELPCRAVGHRAEPVDGQHAAVRRASSGCSSLAGRYGALRSGRRGPADAAARGVADVAEGGHRALDRGGGLATGHLLGGVVARSARAAPTARG